MRVEIRNPYRSRRQYEAELVVDGVVVGKVERGMVQGGMGADVYRTRVRYVTYASARTLADLREELRDPEIQAGLAEALAEGEHGPQEKEK